MTTWFAIVAGVVVLAWLIGRLLGSGQRRKGSGDGGGDATGWAGSDDSAACDSGDGGGGCD